MLTFKFTQSRLVFHIPFPLKFVFNLFIRMELVYTVSKPPKWTRRDWLFRDETPLISLSSRNALALCTTTELSDSDDDGQSTRSVIETIYYVYVCDIDKPWCVHKLMSGPEKVVALHWHISGLKLFVATALGSCYVWQMKDFLLNTWHEPPYLANIGGDEIICAAWLHQGGKVNFNADKKDCLLYSEKMTNSRFAPSMSQFGGKSIDGIFAVTATGMALVTLPKSGSNVMQIQMETLCLSRKCVRVADIAFMSSGEILVASTDGNLASAIHCYKVTLSYQNDVCTFVCQPATSFFAKSHMDPVMRESSTARVTHIKFMHHESGDALIVSTGDLNSSHVELWNLASISVSVHRFFQNSASADSSPGCQILKWIHHSSITHTSLPTSLAVPRFPVLYDDALQSDPSSILFQYIAIAYKDGSIKLISRNSFQPMTTTNLDTGIIDFEYPEKRRKTAAYMTFMQQSFTGCILVGIDQYSCVYVMKVVNTRDPVTQVPATFLVCMLEYLLMYGFDWWDVLTAVKPGMIEDVIQKLANNFAKQPATLQDYLYCRMMAMKGALCRCGVSGQLRSADCHCRLMLHSISTHFRSILRPKVLSANEMPPSERLSSTCNKCDSADIDAVMVSLSPEKKFVVESQILQSMQQLIQWVGDLTLYLLSSLPLLHGQQTTFPGATLLRDARVLGMLRELLVIIRTWGLINAGCLPNFNAMTNVTDCLPQLFKLLTKAWHVARDGNGRDYDETLVDECCALSSQVMLPTIDEGLFGNTDYSNSIFAQYPPLKYTFSDVPAHAVPGFTGHSPAFLSLQGQTMSHFRRDVVRQVVLGVNIAEPTRVCVRCGCLSLLKSISKSPAMKAWELRFERTCVCGGQWKLGKSAAK